MHPARNRGKGGNEIPCGIGKFGVGSLFTSMKTLPPSRHALRLNRSLMLLVLGCTCLTLWLCCKNSGRLCSLVRDSMRRLTRTRIMTEAEVPVGNQVALVPGTSIRGTLLRQRVEAAARLYHAGVVSHLILSGDGRSSDYHEPHAMRQMLLARGVPDYAMREDPAGLSTYESIQRAGQMAAGRRLVIVTQDLYAARALMLARGLHVNAIACALKFDAPKSSVLREDKACVRALMDLAGLRQWTQAMERQGEIRVGHWTLAAL